MQYSLKVYLTTIFLLSLIAIKSASAFLSNTALPIVTNKNGIILHHGRCHFLKLQGAQDEFQGEVEVSRTYGGGENGSGTVRTFHNIRYHIHNRMNLSSQQGAPILVLHGGPGLPSDYLLPLRDVIPYRSIVFYDQLGCGRSPGPETSEAYSIESSLDDLEVVIKKIGLTRFHLYGQSYGGILAFEYMKRVAEKGSNDDESGASECLSAILSSAPSNVDQMEAAWDDLTANLLEEDPDESTIMDRFLAKHACREIATNGKKPQPLADAYEKVGQPGVWCGTDSIKGWSAAKPLESSQRMPSCMAMRGEHDFVTTECIEGWKPAFNHKFVRVKEIEKASHHGLLEDGKTYGEIVNSFFAEYD